MCNFLSIHQAPLLFPESEFRSVGTSPGNADPNRTESGEFSSTTASSAAAQEQAADLGRGAADAQPVDPARDTPQPAVSEAAIKAKQLREMASERWHTAGERAKELNSAAQNRIRENPTKAIFGALGLGLLMGLVMKRASA